MSSYWILPGVDFSFPKSFSRYSQCFILALEICNLFNVDVEGFLSRSTKTIYTPARAAFCHIAKSKLYNQKIETSLSNNDIGDMIGKSYADVIHHRRNAANFYLFDKHFRNKINNSQFKKYFE